MLIKARTGIGESQETGLGVWGAVVKGRLPMVHLVERHFLRRVNLALVLGLFWGALAFCVLAAVAYDIGRLFTGW
jgi:hypothetical protein